MKVISVANFYKIGLRNIRSCALLCAFTTTKYYML